MLGAGDIVLAGFPYADGPRRKYRPALVVSKKEFHAEHGICWVVMITSAENESWTGDVRLPASTKTGLSKESVIRPAKLATLDIDAVEKIGVVPPALLKKVIDFMRMQMAQR